MWIWEKVRNILVAAIEPVTTEYIAEQAGLEQDQVIRAIQQIRNRIQYREGYRLVTLPVLGQMQKSLYKMEEIK